MPTQCHALIDRHIHNHSHIHVPRQCIYMYRVLISLVVVWLFFEFIMSTCMHAATPYKPSYEPAMPCHAIHRRLLCFPCPFSTWLHNTHRTHTIDQSPIVYSQTVKRYRSLPLSCWFNCAVQCGRIGFVWWMPVACSQSFRGLWSDQTGPFEYDEQVNNKTCIRFVEHANDRQYYYDHMSFCCGFISIYDERFEW